MGLAQQRHIAENIWTYPNLNCDTRRLTLKTNMICDAFSTYGLIRGSPDKINSEIQLFIDDAQLALSGYKRTGKQIPEIVRIPDAVPGML